jgi:hypothetical protein
MNSPSEKMGGHLKNKYNVILLRTNVQMANELQMPRV